MIRKSSASATSSGQNSSRAVPAAAAIGRHVGARATPMRAPSPGAMFDSSAQNRSTAKSSGSSSVRAATPGDALGSGVGDSASGVGEPGRPGRSSVRGDHLGAIHAQLARRDERHRRRAGGRRRELLDRSVGQRHAHALRSRARIGISTGDEGGSGSSACCGPTPEQLAGEVGDHDRPRHLERQVALAQVEGEDGRRQALAQAGVEQRPVRAGDHRSRPVGQVDRLRLGRCAAGSGRRRAAADRRPAGWPMPNSSSVPLTTPSALVWRRREGQDRLARQLGRQEAVEHDEVEELLAGRRRRIPRRVAPYSSTLGSSAERVLEVDVARADEQHAPQSVGRHDRPRRIVERQVVGRTRSSIAVASAW